MRDLGSPAVSAIIPTKYRPADLERTVRSLFQQTILPRQLIVIDQSEGPENRGRIEKLHAELPKHLRDSLKLSYVHDSTIVGPIVARNRGMKIAEGGIWAFFDDDVCLEPTYLEELVVTYSRNPELGGVSGIITNYQPPPWPYRLWTNVFLRGNFRDERQPIYWKANRLREGEPIGVSKFTGACMSFRAEVARGHWFDENLPNTFEEDWDFCVSLGPRTMLVVAPRARLLHIRSPFGRSKEHHLRNEARSAHYLHRKHWNRGIANNLSFWWANVGYGLMATLGSLRQWSIRPWRAFLSGAGEGKLLARRLSGTAGVHDQAAP
jgi:GT2 family glycosyltransferase